MWVFTTQGFYSVVADRNDPGQVLVRGRAREDLEALKGQIADLEIFEDRAADYRWRAYVSREQWRDAVAQIAEEIDYPNYKDAVAERQSHDRASVYGRVWSVLQSLQRAE